MKVLSSALFLSIVFSAMKVATSLAYIDTPSVCASTVLVSDSFKTLCHIANNYTNYYGSQICETNKMELYDVNSSPCAAAAFNEFIRKSPFNGGRDARIYVKGRSGSKCSAYSGTGQAFYEVCTKEFNLVCEFNMKPKAVPCTFTSYDNSIVDTCELNQIDFPRTLISNSTSIDRSKIVRVEISYDDKSSSFLPVLTSEIFYNLQILTASGLQISTITELSFTGLTNLLRLDLSSNDISTIYKGTFQDLTSLDYFDIGINKLKFITVDMFAGLFTLKKLFLYENLIQSVSLGAFKDLKSLEELHFEDNKLVAIDDKIFRGLTKLKLLYVDNNLIKAIATDAFKDLESLTTLSVSNNKLLIIQTGILNNLISLEYLNFGYNMISTINSEMFETLANLQKLYLFNNLITTIPNGTFQNLTSVWYLSLQGNEIETITKETFKGMKTLTFLYLRMNQIKQIEDKAFSEEVLPFLQYVDMNGNTCVQAAFSQPNIEHLPMIGATACVMP